MVEASRIESCRGAVGEWMTIALARTSVSGMVQSRSRAARRLFMWSVDNLLMFETERELDQAAEAYKITELIYKVN